MVGREVMRSSLKEARMNEQEAADENALKARAADYGHHL
jgi:hypothetical protein